MTALFAGLAVLSYGCSRPFGGDKAGDAGVSIRTGFASQYTGDHGISADPRVIFADDFESWNLNGTQPREGTWEVRRNSNSLTRVIAGRVESDGTVFTGEHVLEVACWAGGRSSQVGGLTLKLGNYVKQDEGLGDGYDDVYLRYYVKFDEHYRVVRNHGANLGGRDLTRTDAAWVGMAGIRDPSTRGYFYSGVQPYGLTGDRNIEMGFYSYHLDKSTPWGEEYWPDRRIYIEVGTWHCVERHMRLNSVDPGKANSAVRDGLEELWVDGVLTVSKKHLRFRRVPGLRITFFSLETFYHGLPPKYDQSHPIKVYFDNVVIAKSYIGPMGAEGRD
jgi:hypothetical protein